MSEIRNIYEEGIRFVQNVVFLIRLRFNLSSRHEDKTPQVRGRHYLKQQRGDGRRCLEEKQRVQKELVLESGSISPDQAS